MSKNAINYKLSIYYKKNHKVNAPVLIGDKWGVIDKNGKYLTNPQFDEMCYGVANQSTDYVESEYYDASKTISLFLKQYSV